MHVVIVNHKSGSVVDAASSALVADGGVPEPPVSDIIDSVHNNSRNYAHDLHAGRRSSSGSVRTWHDAPTQGGSCGL